MNTAVLKSTSHANHLALSGDLSFTTVVKLWQQSQSLLNSANTVIHIDLSEVTHCDSSGVALLITWQRYALKLRKEIYFLHLPAAMQAMIKVSDLENILSIKIR